MSPQQVPNLVSEAINTARTSPASFKTAEVAGYFGWAWVVVYRALKDGMLWKLIKEGKVHFHLTGWASNIGRKHPNPAKPNSFNNDDLAVDRVNFVRLKVMKNKFAMTVRDEDTLAPGIPATPNANPQVDKW